MRLGTGIAFVLLSTVALFAESNSSKISIIVFATEISQVTGSDNADADKLFRDSYQQFQNRLLEGLNADSRYQAVGFKQNIPLELGAALLHSRTVGAVSLTPEEYQRLQAAQLALLVEIKSWNIDHDSQASDAGYHATIDIEISVLDIKSLLVASTIQCKVSGKDASQAASAIEAAWTTGLKAALVQLGGLLVLAQGPRIVELVGNEIILDIGTANGIMVGDEFAVHGKSSPEALDEVTGVVAISEAREHLSFAQLVWTQQTLRAGDRLQAMPPRIIEWGVMAGCMFDLIDSVTFSAVGADGRITFNRGFFLYRPLVDFGFSILPGTSFFDGGNGVALSLMGGGEMLFRLGSFSIAPNAMLGAVLFIPTESQKGLVFGGFRAQLGLRLSLLVADRLECFLEPAYGLVFSGGNFSGLLVSAGVVFR